MLNQKNKTVKKNYKFITIKNVVLDLRLFQLI